MQDLYGMKFSSPLYSFQNCYRVLRENSVLRLQFLWCSVNSRRFYSCASAKLNPFGFTYICHENCVACVQWNEIIIYILYIEQEKIVHESKLWHQQRSLMLSFNCELLCQTWFTHILLLLYFRRTKDLS